MKEAFLSSAGQTLCSFTMEPHLGSEAARFTRAARVRKQASAPHGAAYVRVLKQPDATYGTRAGDAISGTAGAGGKGDAAP